MSLIRTSLLTKDYHSKGEIVKAVNEVSIEINSGDFVSIMGPSGSGKSTLLTMLGGITRPTSGSVIIDDIDIYKLSNNQLANFRREYIGFVFQSFQLVPYLTTYENVMLPLIICDMHTDEKSDKCMEILDRVGLANKSNRLVEELSGGEQQRVAIARALVNNPVILLADEPTGNLDSNTSQEIMLLLSELNQTGETILMVTHNKDFYKYFNQTINIEDGKIVNELVKERNEFEYN